MSKNNEEDSGVTTSISFNGGEPITFSADEWEKLSLALQGQGIVVRPDFLRTVLSKICEKRKEGDSPRQLHSFGVFADGSIIATDKKIAVIVAGENPEFERAKATGIQEVQVEIERCIQYGQLADSNQMVRASLPEDGTHILPFAGAEQLLLAIEKTSDDEEIGSVRADHLTKLAALAKSAGAEYIGLSFHGTKLHATFPYVRENEELGLFDDDPRGALTVQAVCLMRDDPRE